MPQARTELGLDTRGAQGADSTVTASSHKGHVHAQSATSLIGKDRCNTSAMVMVALAKYRSDASEGRQRTGELIILARANAVIDEVAERLVDRGGAPAAPQKLGGLRTASAGQAPSNNCKQVSMQGYRRAAAKASLRAHAALVKD